MLLQKKKKKKNLDLGLSSASVVRDSEELLGHGLEFPPGPQVHPPVSGGLAQDTAFLLVSENGPGSKEDIDYIFVLLSLTQTVPEE